MGTFTALDPDDARVIAARFGLGAVHRLAPIAAGTINSNFELACDAGRFFLRINEGASEHDVAWEADLVAELAVAGVPVAVPLAVDDRRYLPWQGRLVSVFPWCDGVHLAPAEVTPAAAAALGGALAQIHEVGVGLPPTRQRPTRYSMAVLGDRLDRIRAAAATDAALADVADVLTAEHARLVAAAPTRAAAAVGIIHGDLFRDNVLWVGDRITAILDFEQASAGSLVYDLAVCLNDWCWVDGPIANLATALVSGYQDVRRLGPTELMALPIEVRAAAARFTITRLTDVYLPGIQNPDKDFRAFYRRLLAWQGPELGRFLASV